MTGTTLPLLTAATALANADIFLTRQSGDTTDKSYTGTLLKSFLETYFDTLYQPVDDELTALAGLTSAADKMPYFTGSGTADLTDLSSFGRTLIDDASADAALTTLGVSAYAKTLLDDADADTALSTLGVSTYAKTLLDDTSAGDARTTLGLGSVAVLSEIAEANLSADVQSKLNRSAPNKFDATAAPDADDDDSNTGGNGTFAEGSVWVDVTNDEAYRCVDAATGAAVWINTTLTSDELGTIATQNSNAVSITGGTITGIADIAVADGGTGSSTPSGARTALGVAIGSDVQAWDADLDTIAALSSGDGHFIVGNGSTWISESGNTARASLGVGTSDSPQFAGVNVGHATDTTITRVSAGTIAVEGSNVLLASGLGSITQAYDADLAAIAGLTSAANKLPYFTGAGTAALADLTAFARTILDDADAAAVRTTLGITVNSGWEKVEAKSPSGDTCDFTDAFEAGYVYCFELQSVTFSANSTIWMMFSDDSGSTFDATADHEWSNWGTGENGSNAETYANGDGEMWINDNPQDNISGHMFFYNPSSSSEYLAMIFMISSRDSSGYYRSMFGGGLKADTTFQADSIRFATDSTPTFNGGKITLYRKAV